MPLPSEFRVHISSLRAGCSISMNMEIEMEVEMEVEMEFPMQQMQDEIVGDIGLL